MFLPAQRALLTLALALAAFPALPAAPALETLSPAGATRGATITVTANGKFDKWPVQIWTDTPTLKFEPTKDSGKFTVTIAPDAPPGPHLVRVYNAEGASSPRCFIVGDGSELPEAEPNDDPTTAQPTTRPATQPAGATTSALPVTINAQLEKSADVDCYAVRLAAGQTLVAAVNGRRLGSAIDPLLHLLDETGKELAFAHDGLGLDPLLAFRAPTDGTYIVRVAAFAHPPLANINFAGGKNTPYRLHLTTGPCVRSTYPSAVTRGRRATLKLQGWNLKTDTIEVDATNIPAREDHLLVPIPGAPAPLRIDVSDAPELLDAASTADFSTLTPPVNVSGVISRTGEEDRFAVTARKGQRLILAVTAATTASPLDAVLRIQDPAGKTIATEDDSQNLPDPKIDWTAPADGTYTLVLADRFRKGAPDYHYRLEIATTKPHVQPTVDADAYTLTRGKSTPIKLTATRREGHAGPLVAVATNLPPGVTCATVEVPAKGGDVTLTLTAASDVKPASAPFRILLLGTDPAAPEATPAAYDFKKDKEKPGTPELIDHVPDLWLTVLAPPPATTTTTAPTTAKSPK